MNEYNNFKILFSLYDKFYEGNRGWQECKSILGEDLRYIANATIFADIYVLQEESLINTKYAGLGFVDTKYDREYNPTHLQITSEGIKVVDFILNNYPLFLRKRDDQDSKDQANHILAYPNPRGKRVQTYECIRRQVTVFEEFLQSTNAFSRSRNIVGFANPFYIKHS